MTSLVDISITVNRRPYLLSLPTNRIVADLLREDLLLTGCKIGCDQGVCGACTVLVDDLPVTACTTFAFELDGNSVTTIEGLSEDGQLHPVQRAFLDHSAFQCGFCTPGMILSVKALLDHHRDPDDLTIRQWLGANICRCTGYQMIIEAVRAAARAGAG